MASIWLAKLDAYNPNTSSVVSLYFSSSGYVTSTTNLPPGIGSHIAFEPRIQNPATIRRDCFDRARTYGSSQVGYGALELSNTDGALDYLSNYGLDGRTLTIVLGSVYQGSAPVWTTILTGTVEQPEISWDKVYLRLRDRLAELDKHACQNLYAGSNSLPSGLEGVAGDIKDSRKPKLYGTAYNIAPVLVNTSRLIYQVSDGAINTVAACYDRGSSLTKGTDYTSQSDMDNNSPAAGYFRVWPAGGYIRLGSIPSGLVTCDATQGAAAINRTAAQILKQIAIDAGISSGSISSADVTALDTANSAEIGVWLQEETCIDAMDLVANSIGAYYGFDRLGVLRMKRLEAPSGSAVVTLTNNEIISISREATADEGRGIPTWRYNLGYKQFYVTQDSDLAGAVTDARRSELKLKERTTSSVDSSIKTKHLLATDISASTYLIDSTAAATEASRRLSLYKVDRVMYNVKAGLSSDTISLIDLGAVIKLQINRFEMQAGKDFIVIGYTADYRLGILDLTLWG
jgi:hypothetical protein